MVRSLETEKAPYLMVSTFGARAAGSLHLGRSGPTALCGPRLKVRRGWQKHSSPERFRCFLTGLRRSSEARAPTDGAKPNHRFGPKPKRPAFARRLTAFQPMTVTLGF